MSAPALLLASLAVGCTSPPPAKGEPAVGDTGDTGAADQVEPMLRYLGTAVLDEEVVSGDTTTWTFDAAGRAGCMRGAQYRASTRDAGTDDLLIFLQGGGACWDGFCLVVTEAPAGIPAVDILNPGLSENPLADWNVTYLPYCDGSLFIGDMDHDDDGDGVDDRHHRGLANLSAALDMSVAHFPDPDRVVFAGSSGGGFGVLLAMPLVRAVYRDAELIILADSAVGVARGSADPDFVDGLVVEWGAAELVPEDCTGCLDDGHMTGILDHWLARDPAARMGVFSSWYDLIIGDLFLELPPGDFQAALAAETGRLHDAYPDRYRRFVIDGRMHTTLLGDPTGFIGEDLGAVELPPEVFDVLSQIELGSLTSTASADGTRVADWISGLVAGAEWPDTLDPPGPVPE